MTRKMPILGKGKNMSIAKAALIVFYELELNFIYSGELDIAHEIVEVAGAKHCSFFTHQQVLSRLYSSDYWTTDGKIQGWGNKPANCYVPSEKGKEFYKNKLKHLKVNIRKETRRQYL
jgi:hypothetical protein